MYPLLLDSFDRAMQALQIQTSPRKPVLNALAMYMAAKIKAGLEPKLVVICTHNSRRSHLSQFWLAVAGAQFSVNLTAYSGGTEVTACHPNTLAALQRAGANITQHTPAPNPRHTVAFSAEGAIEVWSKVYADAANPTGGFAALFICAEADAACPFVAGAEARFSLQYLDPKYADGTPNEPAAYDLASQTIAGEMAWVLAMVNKYKMA